MQRCVKVTCCRLSPGRLGSVQVRPQQALCETKDDEKWAAKAIEGTGELSFWRDVLMALRIQSMIDQRVFGVRRLKKMRTGAAFGRWEK